MCFLGVGIIAVLADTQHAGDRNPLPTNSDGPFDGVEDRHVVFLRQLATQPAFGQLIDVQRRQTETRTRSALLIEPFENLAEDDVGVRVALIDGGDPCDR